MNTRPTPETDANRAGWIYYDIHYCHDSLSDDPLPWPDFARKLERERDEARAENIGWQKKWQVAVEMAALAQNELAAVTAQRDRLAEALKEIFNVSSFDYATMPDPARKKYREVVLEMADKALQSLTLKP